MGARLKGVRKVAITAMGLAALCFVASLTAWSNLDATGLSTLCWAIVAVVTGISAANVGEHHAKKPPNGVVSGSPESKEL